MSIGIVFAIAMAVGAAAIILVNEARRKQEIENLLKLRKAKREEEALNKEIEKVTKEIENAEVDYKKKLDDYRNSVRPE